MNIVVLEGQVNNPGDLSWDALDRFGTVTVYDRTSRDQLKTRVAEAATSCRARRNGTPRRSAGLLASR